MMKRLLMCSALLLALSAMLTAHAQRQAPSPEQLAQNATETRQAVFKLLGYNMGAVSGMARGTVDFDAALAERNARRIAVLAPMIPELFAANDTRSFSLETEALPVIWEDMDGFEVKAQELEAAANDFAAIAAGGDRTEILGAVRAFGGTCGSCHREFRVDD